MLSAAVAAGVKGDPVDRLLADLAYARGENEQALALYKALLTVHPDEALLLERGGIAALAAGPDQRGDRAARPGDARSQCPLAQLECAGRGRRPAGPLGRGRCGLCAGR